MTLQCVYLIRRGFYDSHLGEQSIGKIEMRAVAAFLIQLNLEFSKTMLVTSNARRAVFSAEVIKKELDYPHMDNVEWLHYEREQPCRSLEAFAQAHPGMENFIGIGHDSTIGNILRKYAKKFRDRKCMKNARLDPGSIHVIDIPAEKIERIFPTKERFT